MVLPFLFEPGLHDEIRVPKVKAIIFFGGCLGAYFIFRYIRRSLGVGFFGCVFSAVFSGLGPQYQLNVLAVVSSSICLSYLVTEINNKEISRILGFMTLAGVASAIMGYLQIAGHDPIFFYLPGTNARLPVGFLGQQTLYGPFMVTCLLAALFRRNYYAAIFMLFPIYATEGSFAYAALGVGITVWTFSEVNKFVGSALVAIGFFAVSYLYFFHPHTELLNSSGRFEAWSFILTEAVKMPWFGHGLGTFQAYIFKIQPKSFYDLHGMYLQAHNDFIELFFDCGIFGLLIALGLLVDFSIQAWRHRENRFIMAGVAIFCSLLVDSLGNFPFRLSPQGLIALFALVWVVTYKEETWLK